MIDKSEYVCDHCKNLGTEENPVFLFSDREDDECILHESCKLTLEKRKDISLIGYFRPDIADELLEKSIR